MNTTTKEIGMKTNAHLLPLIDHDQYILFCLDEIGHHSAAPELHSRAFFLPTVLCGCEFYTVRWIDRGSRQVFYLIFHMSDHAREIIRQLQLVRLVADPTSITVTTAHNPPNSDVRSLVVATALGLPLVDILHVHNGNPVVEVGKLT